MKNILNRYKNKSKNTCILHGTIENVNTSSLYNLLRLFRVYPLSTLIDTRLGI